MDRNYKSISELPLVSIILVVGNAIIFLICTFSGEMLYNIGDLSPNSFFGEGQYYRAVSAMFLHADITHIVNNMLLLAGLGAMIEKETGHLGFLALYILSGLSGQAVSLGYKIFAGEWYVSSIGASGAVFGLVGVLLSMALCRIRPMPSVTWQRVVLVVVYSLYSGIRATNIDNAAHIGGFISGFLLGLLMCLIQSRRRKKNNNIYRNGWQ